MKVSIEKRLKRLEEITEALKTPTTELQEALTLFEEGVTLSKGIEKELTDIERKVEALVQTDDDTVELTPF
ncbi:MAG: exodeoxyribonuclease VII small subunit [Sphaerochaetaceae bacterium]|jgi:exodeoxyribonuclease VII small subunit